MRRNAFIVRQKVLLPLAIVRLSIPSQCGMDGSFVVLDESFSYAFFHFPAKHGLVVNLFKDKPWLKRHIKVRELAALSTMVRGSSTQDKIGLTPETKFSQLESQVVV
jgi:hypothetical protein